MLTFPDIVLAETGVKWGKVLNGLEMLLREEFGLKINKSQTKVMSNSRSGSKNLKILKVRVVEYRI